MVEQGSGLICDHCGVTVAPGYPKCPKCHSAMPGVASPLVKHGTSAAGGTPATGGFAMWIALLTAAIVVGAVIFFAVRADEDREALDAPVGFAGDAGGEDNMDATAQDLVDNLSVDDGDPAGDGDAGESITAEQALDGLEQALSERRFYSGVEVNPDDETAARIESAHCDDAAMRGTVETAAADLASAGFVRVECYSRHGTRSFEIDLLQSGE